jgi:hypothetical protein
MINITARGFELKQALRTALNPSSEELKKCCPQDSVFDVTLKKLKDGYQC